MKNTDTLADVVVEWYAAWVRALFFPVLWLMEREPGVMPVPGLNSSFDSERFVDKMPRYPGNVVAIRQGLFKPALQPEEDWSDW